MNRFLNFINLFWINFKRNFFKEIALGIGVIIATSTLIIGTCLGDGLEILHKKSILREVPVDQIRISGNMKASAIGPNKIDLGIINIKPDKQVFNISPELIQEIKSWKEVRDIITISKANFPVTVYVDGNSPVTKLPFAFFAEPPIVGIPDKLAQVYLEKYQEDIDINSYLKNFPEGFKEKEGVIPILIPKFINQIGMNFVKNNNWPIDNLLGLSNFANIQAVLGHSHVTKKYPDESKKKYTIKIVGYTDIELTTGIAIPQSVIEQAKKTELKPELARGFEGAVIYAHSAEHINTLKSKLDPLLKKHNLNLQENSLYKKISSYVENGIDSFQSMVHLFSGLILLITGIGIFYAFLYLFIKRESEMGLYRFFGGSQLEVIAILMLEAGLIAFICAMLGYGISYVIIKVYIPELSQMLDVLPASIKSFISHIDLSKTFIFKPLVNLEFVLIAVLFCMASAFFPALIGSFRPIKRN